MKKNERMTALQNAGINTDRYFCATLDNGTTVHLIIDENGSLKQVDPIAEEIIESGYVRNTKLHRRWIMAQMFRNLNYVSYDGKRKGYTEALKNYGYDYTFKMMLEEVRVLSKLEVKDADSFVERSGFFTKYVVAAVLEDYKKKLEAYVETLPIKKCKGVPYKRIKGVNIFVEDLDKKLYADVSYTAHRIEYAKSYAEIYRILSGFMRTMVKLPWDTAKSKEWVDAYKGNGAYYTCKNLIMYHGCKVKGKYEFFDMYESIEILDAKRKEYNGEGWRMFAFMKKLIADNNFNFSERMAEIYSEQ